MKDYFSNKLCSVSLNPDKTFSFYDRTDYQNGTQGYTKLKRGYKKGLEALNRYFNENTRFYDIVSILHGVGLKPKTYCAYD